VPDGRYPTTFVVPNEPVILARIGPSDNNLQLFVPNRMGDLTLSGQMVNVHSIDKTFTDNQGYYTFDGLEPGEYIVKSIRGAIKEVTIAQPADLYAGLFQTY
jgi:hypothetical protein